MPLPRTARQLTMPLPRTAPTRQAVHSRVGVRLVKLPTMSTLTRQTKTKATVSIVRNTNSLPIWAVLLIPRPAARQTRTLHVDTKYMKNQRLVVKIVRREDKNTILRNTNVLGVDPECLHLNREKRASTVRMVSIIQNMANVSKKPLTLMTYHIIYTTLHIVRILVLQGEAHVFRINIPGRREPVRSQTSKIMRIA